MNEVYIDLNLMFPSRVSMKKLVKCVRGNRDPNTSKLNKREFKLRLRWDNNYIYNAFSDSFYLSVHIITA